MITTAALSQTHRDAARDLLDTVTAHDRISPLDEAARLALQGDSAQHLLLEADAAPTQLLGYASVLADGTVQGMVHPDHRRSGHGTALLRAALELRPDAGVWAHGAFDGSLAFLTGAGLRETRRLLTLHHELDVAHPVPAIPASSLEGLRLDAFDAERDADRWVEVNALAFAEHPEQGALTRADLDQRLAEPWFDPEDLLVALRDEELVGFVWVKREATESPDAAAASAGHDAEIYVVATAPSVQGHGVAGHLLAATLNRLLQAGVPGVELYVEADNAPALRLYETWGFAVSGRDVQMSAGGTS
ncbi:mycothiol synthase [Brachybacterium sp. FME24]|uniref:mycothiol synthase n=1 Tax=Brachybacterium sp. FME24 TaxID=2742605 RepID=UPI001866D8BB|nr:mycothiol synthase [Brachybacterium sp. FME24]